MSGRPRRLDGWASVERGLARLDATAQYEVVEALMAIQDDSWPDRYEHLDDVTDRRAVIMIVRPDLVLVWRVLAEYPDWFRVVYLGSPDDYEF